jgi:hypothetical protein
MPLMISLLCVLNARKSHLTGRDLIFALSLVADDALVRAGSATGGGGAR